MVKTDNSEVTRAPKMKTHALGLTV